MASTGSSCLQDEYLEAKTNGKKEREREGVREKEVEERENYDGDGMKNPCENAESGAREGPVAELTKAGEGNAHVYGCFLCCAWTFLRPVVGGGNIYIYKHTFTSSSSSSCREGIWSPSLGDVCQDPGCDSTGTNAQKCVHCRQPAPVNDQRLLRQQQKTTTVDWTEASSEIHRRSWEFRS